MLLLLALLNTPIYAKEFANGCIQLSWVVIAHGSSTARHSDSVRPPLQTQPLGAWRLDEICHLRSSPTK